VSAPGRRRRGDRLPGGGRPRRCHASDPAGHGPPARVARPHCL